MPHLVDSLVRKKYVTFDSSPLPRVLNLFDLTALGVGSTVGVGFYILAGEVARNVAGPAVTICFLIAGIASVFAGLCYAEFGARVPKAGSAYVYSYVCVGEFVAFVIGWNLLLEYVIGTASVARGYSAYVDDLANHKISHAFDSHMHMDVKALAPYPDFFALCITLVLTAVLCIGVKESTMTNNVFTGINIFVISYVIIAGSTQGDVHNWSLNQTEVTPGTDSNVCTEPKDDKGTPDDNPWGTGGFAPYGFNGIMQGAATCFFGFVGFDVIATTGEEALRPERNIPLSISISLLLIFMAYFGMSTVLTLALPYCMEDPDAPLIELFNDKDMQVSKWIVSVGAIFGFSASLLGAMFPMPRVIYAMADDGLIFRFLSRISKRFKTPVIATVISGMFAGIMALLFSLDALVDMMSIGTLMAYTIVSICVMLLRYTPDSETDFHSMQKTASPSHESPQKTFGAFSWRDYGGQLFNRRKLSEPTSLTSSLVNYTTLSFGVSCFLLTLFITLFGSELINGEAGAITVIAIFFLITIMHVVVIALQPESKKELSFKVPFVPYVPALSSFINLYLMCNLSTATWIRFVVWMIIGMLIYFLYGIRESSGSDIPPPKDQPDGIDNAGIKSSNKEMIIPPIVIQPPTPWGSRIGTPTSTSTVKPEPPRRQSIVESTLVFTSNPGHKKCSNGGKNGKNCNADLGTDSQSFDISPPILEVASESSTDTESDSGGEDSEDKSTCTKIVTEATVYATNNKEDYHQIPKEESSIVASCPPSEDILCQPNEHERNKVDLTDISVLSSTPERKDIVADANFDSTDGDPKNIVVGANAGSTNGDHKVLVVGSNTNSTDGDQKVLVANANADSTDSDQTNLIKSKSSSGLPEHAEVRTEREEAPQIRVPLRSTVSSPEFVSEQTESMPGSPRVKRNPLKPLVKAYSFDDLPPSSMDSPFAKRVQKFVVIPIKVAKNDEDTSTSSSEEENVPPPTSSETPLILHPSSHDSKKANLNMASDLQVKLTKLQEHNERKSNVLDSGTQEDKGKAATIEFHLGLTPLDPIRERGESKIQNEDIEELNKKISLSNIGTEDSERKII